MNRIDKKFSELKKKNEKALITFITAGDPDLETTKKIILEMEKNGADIIELGIPYSDPVAEGPVIQSANQRALKVNTTIDKIFNTVKCVRESTKIPLLYLLYYNCIFKYGADKFFSDCKGYGIDGVIIPDLPFERRGEISGFADKNGIYIINLVSPMSGERIEKIASSSKGFLYCVSSLGVTGIRKAFKTDFAKFMDTVNKYTAAPAAIGFGISSPAQAGEIKEYCDGVIVGSAIVKIIEESSDSTTAVKKVSDFTRSLKESLL